MPLAPEYLHLVHQGPFPALIYGRASRDPKKRGRSVADQIDAGRDLCDTHGWPIAEVFDQDVDRSASRHARRERKDFESLLAAIEAGKGRIVVAWEASRYYRDLEAYIRLRNVCRAANVFLCYNGQVYDLSKREDLKATAQDAIAAEDEAEGIRDRVLRTTRAQAKKGLPHGRLLWGYARRYDPETGELIEQYPHPERAHIVLSIFERVAAGETEYSILQDLKREERLPGVEWGYYHLTNMLRNIGYKGRRVHRGEDFGEASWPGLVPEELFDQVQEIIGDESRTTVRDYAVKHLLSGIARCGECEDHPHLRVGKSRGYLVYGCSGRFDSQMNKDKLDAYVEEAVVSWLGSKAAVAAFQSDEQEKRAERARVRQRALERQLDEAREMSATFKEDGVTPRLSLASLAVQEDRLVPQIEAARLEAQELNAPPLVRRLVGRPDVQEIWDGELTIEQQRTVLRAVVNIRLNRARSRGVRTIEPGRITLRFFGQEDFREQPRYARAPSRGRAAAGETE
jgi:site-specific DNA recombinase